MALLIRQDSLDDPDETEKLTAEQTLWAYNAMDAMVTSEVEEELRPQLDEHTGWIYHFELACLAPAMEMALRGVAVDHFTRDDKLRHYAERIGRIDEVLSLYGKALNDPRGILANSHHQLKRLLYDELGFPRQYKYDSQAKEEKLSVDRESLEKLAKIPLANPIIRAVLAYRDASKMHSVLLSGVDSDGRMRFSFNVGGTETGRWSSSKNIFGGGMNAQNITEELRQIFTASPGYKLAYIDLEQAESRAVALLSEDTNYSRACDSGDLHTSVTALIWPRLAWSGDLVGDRRVADQLFYRQFSYRDMAKRGGHGTNYLGTPRTMAQFLKVEEAIMRDFQAAYFRAFPGIAEWHGRIARELQATGRITTPFGRRRIFLGRLGDSATLREAVAYGPQSLIADYMNAAVCRLWSWGKVRLLAQVHDAVLFEYPESADGLVEEARGIISRPLRLLDGRPFAVPSEAAVGWNWGKASEENPSGLMKLKGADKRQRPAQGSVLERRFA